MKSSRVTMEDVMTSQPLTIGLEESLATARAMMRENGVHQLPVLEHGELAGIIRRRDLDVLDTLGGGGLDGRHVRDAMSTDTYAVAPGASLQEVAKTMADEGYGCAVVMERERVIGIFTSTDALRWIGRGT